MARIVFDLDGTLIDSAPDLHAVANRILSAERRATITLDDARSYIGNGAGVFVARMRQARGMPDREHDRILAAFMADYEGAVYLTRLMTGAVPALARLLADGHRLGLCTNKPAGPCRSVLAHLGLTRFFEVVITGDSLPQRKPHPAPVQAAFAALGDGPMVYVGDSGIDAEAARAAGVPFLLYSGGYAHEPLDTLPHAARFDRFSDLPSLIHAQFAEAS